MRVLNVLGSYPEVESQINLQLISKFRSSSTSDQVCLIITRALEFLEYNFITFSLIPKTAVICAAVWEYRVADAV